VVAASNVNSGGDGSITMLSQNDTADGWRTLAVSQWRVASFGNQTPYGWLHDPAGRGVVQPTVRRLIAETGDAPLRHRERPPTVCGVVLAEHRDRSVTATVDVARRHN